MDAYKLFEQQERELRPYATNLARKLYWRVWVAMAPSVDAEDLLQDGLLALWQGCKQFNGDGSDPGRNGYLKQKLRHGMLDGIRRMSPTKRKEYEKGNVVRQISPEEAFQLGFPVPRVEDGTENKVSLRDQISKVFDAISCLRQEEALALIGYYREGRAMLSIGRWLGMTESNVSMLITNAAQKIREELRRRERFSES